MHAHSYMVIQVVLGLVMVGAAMAAQRSGEDKDLDAQVKELILECLIIAHITRKEACAVMHIDQSQWSRIERSEAHTPSLTRLLCLPWTFWQIFLPKLAWVIAMKRCGEIADDVRALRAS